MTILRRVALLTTATHLTSNHRTSLKKTLQTILIAAIALHLSGAICSAKLIVIAHPEVSATEIKQSRLKQIYLNRSKKWADGSRIRLTILNNQPAAIIFIDKYLGKSQAQFNRYWKQQLFSGRGIPPEYFTNLKEFITYIKTTQGAIGLIDSNNTPEGVSVIQLIK